MFAEALFSPLQDAFDGQKCFTILRQIWENDRLFSFDAFARTAGVVEQAFRTAGLTQVENLALQADGQTRYGDWVIPRAWVAREAVLGTPEGEVFADYRQVPCSLLMYSAATEGITAPVVLVDDPAQPPRQPLVGCLLLTGLPAKALVPLALSQGAVGILSDHIPLYPGTRDSRAEVWDVFRWDNDFIQPVNDTGLFGFSLSPERGGRLRAMLQAGPVTLYARVDTESFDGACHTVSAAIEGSDPEAGELLLYGHLYEPGALDNASGCAVLLELSRVLAAGIASGALPRPRQTLRFALGYECAGSMGYLLAHPERTEKTLACVVADMVGTDAIDRTCLGLWHNPLSQYAAVDVLLPATVRAHQAFSGQDYPYKEVDFAVGTDNIIGDPCWGIPTVAMITSPALSYHSSLDVPERIDPEVLRRSGVILGSLLLSLATLDAEEAHTLAGQCDAMIDAALAKADGDEVFAYAWELAKRRCRAQLLRLAGSAESPPDPPLPDSLRLPGPVPQRLVPGCLTFAGRPELAGAPWQPAWNDRLHLPLFWADGQRTLPQIALLSALESGQEEAPADRIAWLRDYFDFLSAQGYLRWAPPSHPEEEAYAKGNP